MLEQQILDTFLFSPQWIDPVDPHPAGVTHPWHSFALPRSLPRLNWPPARARQFSDINLGTHAAKTTAAPPENETS